LKFPEVGRGSQGDGVSADVTGTVEAAERNLLQLIRGEASPIAAYTRAEVVSRGEERLRRIRNLLEEAGRPERSYPVIHIAGTSGKGSVAAYVDAICQAAGIGAGLHMTPYLQTPLEKLVYRGRMAAPLEFRELVDWILDLQNRLRSKDQGHEARYGSSWVALTMEYFRRKNVDVAILEAGAGGRFDLTNAVAPLITAVTSVGMDHVKTLGPTIRDIAWHKAGIFKEGTPALMLETDEEVLAVLRAEAKRVGARLRILGMGTDFVVEPGRGVTFHGNNFRVEAARPRMPGRHQLENAAVAMAIADEMAGAGFSISSDDVGRGIRNARLPGRLELVSERPDVYLDGAHNEDKAAALARSLGELLGDRRLTLVLGVLGYKSVEAVTAPLASLASKIVVTEPQVYMKRAYPAENLRKMAIRYCEDVVCEPNPGQAMSAALADADPEEVICVAGSMYLVGNVRSRWYPLERVNTGGNSWPDRLEIDR
jgi:dihydrofolate synthase/folylpolyglutamate synthase